MIRTRVGYAGGLAENPDYNHIGDHAETVQLDYDPGQITYEELLEIFWKSHNPFGRSWSRQYRNAVFVHNEEQRRRAENSRAALENRTGKSVKTQITEIRSFTLAEEYHQKYLLKQHSLKREMKRIYPRHQDFMDSTAVARLNGYVGGNGSQEQLIREIDSLGLSPEGKEKLDGIRFLEKMPGPR